MLNHIGIIMDGNGRWATIKNKSRSEGHTRGAEVGLNIIKHVCLKKIPFLTLYALSIQNLNRPTSEISHIIKLIKKLIPKLLILCLETNSKGVIVGDRSYLDEELTNTITDFECQTKNNTGTQVSMCLFYDGRQEIVNSCNNGNLTQESISNSLLPDVDLIIRTGGEQRISNFLTWQSAYAELFFTKTLWPDFTIEEFEKIISEFFNRNRTFGKVNDIPDINVTYECFEILLKELKNETRDLSSLYDSIPKKPIVKFTSKNVKRNNFFINNAMCSDNCIKFILALDDIIDENEKDVLIEHKKLLSVNFSQDTLNIICPDLIDSYVALSSTEHIYLQNIYKCEYLQIMSSNKEIWRYCSNYYFIQVLTNNFFNINTALLLSIVISFVDDNFDKDSDIDELKYLTEDTYSTASAALFNLHDDNINFYGVSLNDLIYCVSSIILKKNEFENESEVAHYLTNA
jgi:undecaprenyl diphosphate synthase